MQHIVPSVADPFAPFHPSLYNRDVYRYEGPSALFKGLGPTLVGVMPGRYETSLCLLEVRY